ncbi:MAG: ABC transporter permease [Saprospiraceae bacterium]|jgi:ABC-2 type transport system permease protein|nr:ABC transporter permease [Saprospiraceae bacterium]MBL0025417.1 ABC transporter permease [Saprospiraceae bacterium]
MTTFIFILKKEFRQIFRDPAIIRIIFIMPMMQLIILPFAADYEVKNINIGIVDHDHSDYSRELISKIENSTYFRLTGYTNTFKEGLKWVEDEKADLIVEIPNRFEAELIKESKADLLLAVNAVNGTRGNLGAAYTLGIIQQFNQNIRAKWFQMPDFNPEPIIDVTYSSLYNPLSNYQFFMVPGILAVLLTMVGGFLSALNIVKEKEIGTIEQLNVSPIKKYQFIGGKVVPFWLLGFVILTIGLIISFIVHGIVPGSNIGVLYLFTAIYMLAILGFGLLLSNFTNTQQQAMMVAFFFMLIFILLSGLYTPIESMPGWAQKVAALNPVTYMVEVMRMVLMKGAILRDILPQLKIITLYGVVLNLLAIYTYSKQNS